MEKSRRGPRLRDSKSSPAAQRQQFGRTCQSRKHLFKPGHALANFPLDPSQILKNLRRAGVLHLLVLDLAITVERQVVASPAEILEDLRRIEGEICEGMA